MIWVFNFISTTNVGVLGEEAKIDGAKWNDTACGRRQKKRSMFAALMKPKNTPNVPSPKQHPTLSCSWAAARHFPPGFTSVSSHLVAQGISENYN